MSKLDERLHAFRPDLADMGLKDQVDAKRFVSGTKMQVTAPILNLHLKPSLDARQVTQALMGEIVTVFDVANGWAWLQLSQDGYVGYADASKLSSTMHEPTHRVSVLSTLLYPKPDLKSQPVQMLSLNAVVAVLGIENGYAQIGGGGYVYAAHLATLSEFTADYVAVAEMFVRVPYLWGGKGAAGLDCSGLVQIALQAAGRQALRDADMQEETLGTALLINDLASLSRGDLVFWDGHVGIMSDAETLLHANGYHMMVVQEPLVEAIARISATGKPVTSLKRFQ